jgi:CheY-like chemotaxis protein
MQGQDPDLILMDIQMPIMDGYETVRRIRAAGYTKPIIALTAHAMKEEGQKCMDAGCDGVLTKPARRKELLGKIQDVLAH